MFSVFFDSIFSSPLWMGIIGGILALALFFLGIFGLLGPQEQAYRLGGQ